MSLPSCGTVSSTTTTPDACSDQYCEICCVAPDCISEKCSFNDPVCEKCGFTPPPSTTAFPGEIKVLKCSEGQTD